MKILIITIILVISISSALGQNAGYYYSNQPEQPIIGILSQPNPHSWANVCGEYVQDTYPKWLAGAGIRSVVIHYDTPKDQLLQQLSQLNGALFTGGALGWTHVPVFYNTAKTIYDYAVKTATETPDNKFVLWGTCQGFQLVSVIASGGDNSLLHCDYNGVDNAMLPLNMTSKANSSRFFSMINQFAPTLYDDFTKKNSTANAHECGLTPSSYTTNANLNAAVDVLSINVDINGQPFASTIEHKTAAVYATQWHPEIPVTWWISNINHGPSTIEPSRYASSFLASRLRMNNHTFPPVPLDPISGNPVFKGTNNWLTTMVNQFPTVQEDPSEFAGFYCVGGYNPPASATEQQLRDELANEKAAKKQASEGLLVMIIVFALLVVGTLLYYWQKRKQERIERALGGYSPRNNNNNNVNGYNSNV